MKKKILIMNHDILNEKELNNKIESDNLSKYIYWWSKRKKKIGEYYILDFFDFINCHQEIKTN